MGKFVYSKKKLDFISELDNEAIDNDSIVFIEDSKQIWTHGGYYGHRIIYTDIQVDTWNPIDDINFPYNYSSDIPLDNVTEHDHIEVTFDITCALSGNYSPICESFNGGVKIYSKVAEGIIIPTIIVHKGS